MKRAIVGRCIGTTDGGAAVYLVLWDLTLLRAAHGSRRR